LNRLVVFRSLKLQINSVRHRFETLSLLSIINRINDATCKCDILYAYSPGLMFNLMWFVWRNPMDGWIVQDILCL